MIFVEFFVNFINLCAPKAHVYNICSSYKTTGVDFLGRKSLSPIVVGLPDHTNTQPTN
jgi:hypothetical protein